MGKEVMGKKENEMAQEKERPAGSQSLFRGLMLIEILSNYPNGCPLAHLSELAGLNKSTVHRLLQGLQSCGYVTTAPAAGSYRLTTKFIAVEVDKLIDGPTRDAKLQRIMDYVTSAERADENQAIRLPGHEFTTLLAENRRNGITVDDSVWAKIQAL